MGDYSGIGDAMVGLAVLAAFLFPAFVGALIALAIFAFGGPHAVAWCFAGAGLVFGVSGAAWVRLQA